MSAEEFRPSQSLGLENPEQLGQFFKLFRPYLLAVAEREFAPRLNDGCRGSDLVQETYLAAHLQWKQFNGSTSQELLAWLRAILRYKILQQRRQRRRLNGLTSRSESLATLAEDPYVRATSPDLQVEKEEDLFLVLQMLQAMPELQQQIIQGRIEREETFVEIGSRLGMTADAARMAFGRAVHVLRSQLPAAVSLAIQVKRRSSS